MGISVLHDLGELFIHPLGQRQDATTNPVRLENTQNEGSSNCSPYLLLGLAKIPNSRDTRNLPSGWDGRIPLLEKSSQYLVSVGQTLAVFGNVLSDENVGVFKQDVQQLVDTVQTLLPHVRLQRGKRVNFLTAHREETLVRLLFLLVPS